MLKQPVHECGSCNVKRPERSCKPALKRPVYKPNPNPKPNANKSTIECGVEPARPSDITPGINLCDRGLGWVRIVYVDTHVTNVKA